MLLIFDLDDTLVYTSVNYEISHLLACTFVLEYAGSDAPYKNKLIELQEEIDDKVVQNEGFSEEYHQKALLQLLEQVCADANITVSDKARRKMCEISKYPFEPRLYTKKQMIPYAEEILAFAKKQNMECTLLTRGVEKVQRMKVEQLGLYSFIAPENVHIIRGNDKSEMLKKLSEGYDKTRVGLVDDALPMINAATALGLLGLFIPLKRGCRKRENDINGVMNKELTIPLEKIIKLQTEYPNYRSWNKRLAAKDLPEYFSDYYGGGIA